MNHTQFLAAAQARPVPIWRRALFAACLPVWIPLALIGFGICVALDAVYIYCHPEPKK